jgi:uncharacterized RmlC-like cupin family protein
MKNKQDKVELNAVEDHDGLLTIRGGGSRRDWNGIHYKQGMSAKNVGTTKLSVNIATVPPGGVAAAHIHVGFELILYILEGSCAMNLATDSSRCWKTRPATSSTSSPACPTKSST